MNEVTFDPAREVTFYFRCNRAGSITFTFTYSDGTPYSFIYTDDLEFNIYKNQGDKKKLISLNYISGLTISGNSVTTSITKALSNIPEGEYYAELYRTDLEKTWICGDAIFHNGKFDGVTQTSDITINEAGDTISVTIDSPNPSSVRVYQVASTPTLTLNVDSYDAADVTAQAEALVIANPSGTPANLREINYRVRDNGTARAITFGNQFEALANSELPTTTVVGEALLFTARWNATTSKWQVQNAGSGGLGFVLRESTAINRKISADPSLAGTTVAPTVDLIPILDMGEADASKNKNITPSELAKALPLVKVFNKSNTSYSVTGTTSETIINEGGSGLLVPVGSFLQNDIVGFTPVFSRIGTAGTVLVRGYFNSSASLVGATLIYSLSVGTVPFWLKMFREMVFKNSLSSQKMFPVGVSAVSDVITQGSVAPSSLTIDFSVAQYYLISIQLGNSTDAVTLEGNYIDIKR